MKTKSQILKAAEWAKANGYIYISSVVKSKFRTVYYHLNKVDDIISTGKWNPAPKVQFPSGAKGRYGQTQVPENTVSRSWALENVRNTK